MENLTEKQWERIKEVFEAALESDTAEQEAFIRAACGNDEAACEEVRQLLLTRAHTVDFLEKPPLVNDEMIQIDDHPFDAPGKRVGSYQLLHEIGHGGMGAVYLAARVEEYRHQVAIKLVWPGPDSAEIVRRFLQERQILADLTHPNIARLLDGGTTEDGRPYVVMEYIQGVPITNYCNDRRLALADRLRLFRAVCAAVSYAHRKMVVHRDLKPSNILVTDEGVVKLLDFGIAKLIASEARAVTIPITRTGLHLMTPEYASPEQAREEESAPPSDIYSLGVVLYELLTGCHPHHLKSRPLYEIIRIICHEDPLPPSVVVGRSNARTEPDCNDRMREGERRALQRRLRGDLDNITFMALRKAPQQRYRSVDDLDEDIRRHLSHEPVMARGITWSYRVERFIRRHPVAVTILALLALSFVAGAMIARRQARQERWLNYATDMRLAGQDLANGNLHRALALVDAHRPGASDDDAWRGFEWYCFWDLLHAERLVLQHKSWVYNFVFTPDEKKIFTITREGQIEMWDAINGQPLGVFGNCPDGGRWLDISRDGKKLLSEGLKGEFQLWDVTTGQVLAKHRVNERDEMSVHCLPHFSPDGKLILTPNSNVIQIRDAATLQPLDAISLPVDIRSVEFSPDSRFLAIGGMDGVVRLWDMRWKREITSFSGNNRDDTAYSMAFSADGKLLYASSRNGLVRIWNVASRKLVSALSGHTELVDGLDLSPDEKILASSGDDSTLRLWDTATGQALQVIKNECPISSLRFSPSGSFLAGTCMRQMRVKVWEVSKLLSATRTLSAGYQIDSFAFSPDGSTLATYNYNSAVAQLWKLPSGNLIKTHQTRLSNLSFLGFSSSGQLLAVTSGGVIFSPQDDGGEQVISTLKGSFGPLNTSIRLLGGNTLATLENRQTVKLWDIGTGNERLVLRGHAGDVNNVVLSPDGRQLASTSWDNTVKLWDAATGKELVALKGHGAPVTSVCYSPDGGMIASGSWDYTIKLWEARTGRELRTLRGHGNTVNDISFSPDGKRLASCGDDYTVRIWEPETGAELFVLKEHPKRVWGVRFSPDGRTLVSASQDRIALWRAATAQEVRARNDK